MRAHLSRAQYILYMRTPPPHTEHISKTRTLPPPQVLNHLSHTTYVSLSSPSLMVRYPVPLLPCEISFTNPTAPRGSQLANLVQHITTQLNTQHTPFPTLIIVPPSDTQIHAQIIEPPLSTQHATPPVKTIVAPPPAVDQYAINVDCRQEISARLIDI